MNKNKTSTKLSSSSIEKPELNKFLNQSEIYEELDNIPVKKDHNAPTIGDIIEQRFNRRQFVKGSLGVAAMASIFSSLGPKLAFSEEKTLSHFDFAELEAGIDETHHIAKGYKADILLSWGDPIMSDSPAFDPYNQTAEAQLKQFGYNNDFVGFIPLQKDNKRGLLCVNHEYMNQEMMFPGLAEKEGTIFDNMTKELVDIEMAAHGCSIVEIKIDEKGNWRPVLESNYNRRITPLTTEIGFDGPAAGHERLKTSIDPEGLTVKGTLNNCAGGITPWGTYLASEENFHGYFMTNNVDKKGYPVIEESLPFSKSRSRYRIPAMYYAWGKYHNRFNFDKEPNESNKFGWVVEIDPFDPTSKPVKHTSLGRFCHEGAETIISKSNHAVVYCGDDTKFEYVYKFISNKKFNPQDLKSNKNLLSNGTLYVAKFLSNGVIKWLPLVYGEGLLTKENGFSDQGSVLIDTRLAADLVGATPMDRPEDIVVHPKGKVYVMLTNNTKRSKADINPANPRANNYFGHIIEINEHNKDHSSLESKWNILVMCGDPKIADVGATWNPSTSDNGWFSSPDNGVVDGQGRLWVATDQGSSWSKTGKADGLYSMETTGKLRGTSKLFFRCPVGSEMCGPFFTPDDETAFVAVQHPGSDGAKHYKGFERNSTFNDPVTRWPNFNKKLPPRPSVVAIRRIKGGKIA